jgi:predicted cupin superfamily sugar epimerase
MDPRAAELIRDLELTPHPEGGFYRLPHGSHGRWHRVRSDEVWRIVALGADAAGLL